MRRTIVLLLAGTLLGFNLVKDPGSAAPIVWQNPSVTMQIQQDGSDDVTDGSDVVAIQSALATWNAVSCSAFRFVDGGLTASRTIATDGINRITFVESNWPGSLMGSAAYTARVLDGSSPRHWIEADISINGVDFSWSTTGDVQKIDIQSVALHELGHVLGFEHSSNAEATMYFADRRGTTYARTLHADDIAGACYLYPATPPASCATDADCPLFHGLYGGGNLQTHCNTGSHVCEAGASSTYGAACFLDADCVSGSCRIDPANPPSSEPGFCSQSCTAGSCPNGDFCAGGFCVLGRDDCTVDADCGGNSHVCARDLNGRYRCLKLCLRDSVCAATPGAVCHGGTGANPPGFCRVPGSSPPGTPCNDGLSCMSLACTLPGPMPACAPGTPGFVGGPGDAGAISDASAVDVGPLTDGGGSRDAAGVIDGSPVAPDAAAGGADGAPQSSDAAAVETDGGAPGDALAGAPDAARQGDGGSGADGSDAGGANGGCGCSTAPGPSEPLLSFLGLLFLLKRGRRRDNWTAPRSDRL